MMLAIVGVARLAVATTAPPTFFEQNGLRVEVEVSSLTAGADAKAPVRPTENTRLRFRVREAGPDGTPVAGLAPLAWIVGRESSDPVPDRAACEYQIRALLAGRLARAADVNLNEYLVVTLDENSSVSLIDPQIESSKTKTVGMVSLTSIGEDFVLTPDRRRVLVTLRAQHRVAEADLFGKMARYLEVGGAPRRIALAPDGRLAWTGDAAQGSVTAIAVEGFTRAGAVDVGPGPHEIAFRDDSRYVFVASPASDRLAVIDAQTFARAHEVDTGPGLVGLAYSVHSAQVYVALADGTVVVIDGRRFTRTATVSLGAATSAFGVSNDGRFAVALHRATDRLSVLDLATNKVIDRETTALQPDRVAFTDSFAYVRHAGSGDFLLLDLHSLRTTGETRPSTIVMGQRPAASVSSGDAIAPSIAALPEGGGALILNQADRSIYHFMEGMNAPMGTYPTYPWPARGLLIANRTIREVEKGLYETEFKAPAVGTYTVPFLVPANPQLWGCFSLEIQGGPETRRAAGALKMESALPDGPLPVGTPLDLRVRLSDPDGGKPLDDLDDVMLLVMRGPIWQWRGAAQPLGNGEYQVRVTFPEAGQYVIMLSSPSRGVEFGSVPSIIATAVGNAGSGVDDDAPAN